MHTQPTRLLLATMLFGLAARSGLAQPEIVPAEHSVYAFLHQQRVAGRLPAYRHETLPVDRRTIREHLDALDGRRDDLTGTTRWWLDEYVREFFEPADGIERVIEGDQVRIPSGTNTEKYFIYHRDDDWRAVVSLGFAGQSRAADDTVGVRGLSVLPVVTLEGNYRNLLGWYSSTFNGLRIAGDTRVLQRDPVLEPLYYVGRQAVPPGSFDRTSASLRVAGPTFFGELAHERLRIGASADRSLIITDASDYFSFIRGGLDTRVVHYQFVHAALGERSRNVAGDSGFVLAGTERFMAMHRVQVDPVNWLSLAFTEAVIYGNRGPELAYLNPLFPIKPAEHALWDRDNAIFAVDGVIRPFRGVEGYGTFLADDLDLGRLRQQSFTNKWAIQGGFSFDLEPVAPGATAWVEYTRIGPFVYTHRFELEGSFYNSYVHNGYGIGHPIGPNADQWAGGVRLLLPFRARVDLTGRWVRRGENYFDEEGRLVNVGGDIQNGAQPGFEIPGNVFLAGRRHRGPGMSLEATWEPIREAGLRLFADFQRWDPGADETFVRAEVFVNL
jgi:hypothetical protein